MAVVSRAFQVLSDAEKKQKFDQFGGDPDSRFGTSSASTASPFSGFARTPGGGRGPMFEDEISPEEMFNRFFGGGGMGGGPFGKLKTNFGDRRHAYFHIRRFRLRATIRLQSRRWSRLQGTPIWRRPTTTKTTRSQRGSKSSTSERWFSAIKPTPTPDSLRPAPSIIYIFLINPRRTFLPIRVARTPLHHATHNAQIKRRLLSQSDRGGRLQQPEAQRS